MNRRKRKSKKKLIIIIFVILALVLLIIFGARIYLYINALIGNDLIIKLNTDKESLSLANGESGKINFNVYTISNIFCETQCISKFISLSNDQVIGSDNFNARLPKNKEYEIFAPEYGTGIKLYRFNVECISPKTFLCNTDGKLKKSSILITLNYNLSKDQESLKNKLKNDLESYFTKQDYFISSLTEFNKTIKQLSKNIKTQELESELNNLLDLLNENHKTTDELLILWKNENYYLLREKFDKISSIPDKFSPKFTLLKNYIEDYLSLYNSLIGNMTKTKKLLETMNDLNLSEDSAKELNDLIKEYNNLQLNFSTQDLIRNKAVVVLNLSNKTLGFYNEKNKTIANSSSLLSKIKIYDFNYSEIYPNSFNTSSYILDEPSPLFCFNNSCQNACNEKCYENIEKYPVIFLHGHSFNEKLLAQASLDAFEDIQRSIEDNNYLNAGSLLLSSQKNNTSHVWGNIPWPLSIKASYYFDILSNQGKNILIESKTDNLDTYTLRLKDIIEEVKLKTNRKKVIIIAHSMGGLIARRYLQVFGEEDIQKLILIATPNKGISGSTLDFCPVFGTKLECNDMDKNSLFISKLNNAKRSILPIYNIITIGCETNEEEGDGIVTNSSQYLDFAENYYIKGSCIQSKFKYLHYDILDPEKYPEIIEILKGILKE